MGEASLLCAEVHALPELTNSRVMLQYAILLSEKQQRKSKPGAKPQVALGIFTFSHHTCLSKAGRAFQSFMLVGSLN